MKELLGYYADVLPIEQWRDVSGFEGIYQISNNGVLKSYDRYVAGKFGSKRFQKGKVQRPEITRKGYIRYTMSIKKGSSVRKLAHVLVAQHFIDKVPGKTQVNHKDGVKSNNVFTNLEWATGSENVKHAFETGLSTPNHNNKGKIGSLASSSKKIQVSNCEGEILGVFDTIQYASKETGIHKGMISRYINGRIEKMRSGLTFKVIPSMAKRC